ncbi:hypothetical protein Agub_g11000, partial [Astrephomene gubernaculifera]
ILSLPELYPAIENHLIPCSGAVAAHMAELITEDQPRIKFSTSFVGHNICNMSLSAEVGELSRLMAQMERMGAAPILNDGQVAGNCAISPRILQLPSIDTTDGSKHTASGPESLAVVSMSGKPPGHLLDPSTDFVLVTNFDRALWAAEYRSRDASVRPSSDSPLLVAALAHGFDYGWSEQPAVVLHGHALAEGEGLSYATQLGLPISPRATLFSTPEDLAELEALFRSHPYPQHRCYIRRGHGFFLLAGSVAEAEALFAQLVLPWLLEQQQRQQVH